MILDITDGLARIDLGKEALEMADAAGRDHMITAIVQALTEFPTVEKVEFLIGGQRMERFRTAPTSPASSRAPTSTPNLPPALSVGVDAQPVTLYFPGQSASVLVPVTRMVYSEPDITTAVVELCKGPARPAPWRTRCRPDAV